MRYGPGGAEWRYLVRHVSIRGQFAVLLFAAGMETMVGRSGPTVWAFR
jgi:hypothetical protein